MYFNFKKLLSSMCFTVLLTVYTAQSQKSSPPAFRIESGVTSHFLKNSVIGNHSIISAGVFVLFPTTLNNVALRFGADMGKLQSASQSIDMALLLTDISLVYLIRVYNSHLLLSPSLSLINCAFHLNPSDDFENVAIIATWENEFGVGAGTDISLQFNRFIITTPFTLSTIFSLKPAYIYSMGLRVGIHFNL